MTRADTRVETVGKVVADLIADRGFTDLGEFTRLGRGARRTWCLPMDDPVI
ncbi:hypothetical protein [Amycolatopsis pittospori]|uniref:hypothetical protein n=1 Tax=Amycolatopsis pittospori TaxID=2749434 RepID=UPI0015F0DA76|nr:hypothetical protein [Amycolatopsis pittospori]